VPRESSPLDLVHSDVCGGSSSKRWCAGTAASARS
jgi:hypothetical protein